MHYTNEQISNDIIAKFIELVGKMTVGERNIKRASLSGLTPNQMLKHIQDKSKIGKSFVSSMLAKGYAKATGIENKKPVPNLDLPN